MGPMQWIQRLYSAQRNRAQWCWNISNNHRGAPTKDLHLTVLALFKGSWTGKGECNRSTHLDSTAVDTKIVLNLWSPSLWHKLILSLFITTCINPSPCYCQTVCCNPSQHALTKYKRTQIFAVANSLYWGWIIHCPCNLACLSRATWNTIYNMYMRRKGADCS